MSVPLGTAHEETIAKFDSLLLANKDITLNVATSEPLAGAQDNKITKPFTLLGGLDNTTSPTQLNPLQVTNTGSLAMQLSANDGNDGTGTGRVVKCDGNGILFCKEVGTVNVAPANTLNSGITNDPANSVAVGLRARQTIGDASTETFLHCDANGGLFVDNASFGHLSSISTNTGKITQGEAVVTAGGNGLQQVLLYGKNGSNGNLEPLETVGDRLLVDCIELSPTGPHTPTSLPSVAIHGQVNATSGFKNLNVGTDGSLHVSHVSNKSTTAYTSQSLTGSSFWSVVTDASTFSKVSIAINSSAVTNIVVYGCETSGGTYVPVKSLMPMNTPIIGGTGNLADVELVAPPKFIKLGNPDAGGVTLESVIITLQNN